jgi:hypothetical protein
MRDQEARKVRVTYMLGNLNKEDFATTIYKQEREHQKAVDIYHILDLISISGIEAFHAVTQQFPRFTEPEWIEYLKENPGFPSIQDPLRQLHAVREYCNEQLKQVSITYHCTVNEYDDLFTPHSVKYNMNGEKKK